MKFETNKKRMALFSTISLTDIVLLLLIFFLLTSSFVVQPGIKVKLPKAASGDTDESNKVFLTVTKRNQVFLNQKQIGRDQLGTELRRLLSEDKDKVVVIRADKDLSLESTIKIVDIAKLAGAERFMIATEAGL